MVTRIAIFFLVAVALAGLLAYSQWAGETPQISGVIEADEIRIGSRVGGRVQKVNAEEGQHVQRGDVLVVLEPFDLLERRAEAEARLVAAKAEYAQLSAGFREEEIAQAKAKRDQLEARLSLLRAGPRKQEIKAAEARLDAAEADTRLAEQEYERTLKVFRQGATTQAEMDRVSEQRNAAAATLVVRQQELAELKEGTRPEEILEAEAMLQEAEQVWLLRKRGYRPEEVEQAKAAVEAAASVLRSIDEQIAELQIKAPVDGIVEALELQPGDLVSAGAPVLSLMDIEHLWMRAYVPQEQLDIQTGDPVTVTIDSFPGEQFPGKITFVSRQAEYTPSNVQTPEERSKQVFRIKVSLGEGAEKLRPGMAGNVYLESPAE